MEGRFFMIIVRYFIVVVVDFIKYFSVLINVLRFSVFDIIIIEGIFFRNLKE